MKNWFFRTANSSNKMKKIQEITALKTKRRKKLRQKKQQNYRQKQAMICSRNCAIIVRDQTALISVRVIAKEPSILTVDTKSRKVSWIKMDQKMIKTRLNCLKMQKPYKNWSIIDMFVETVQKIKQFASFVKKKGPTSVTNRRKKRRKNQLSIN